MNESRLLLPCSAIAFTICGTLLWQGSRMIAKEQANRPKAILLTAKPADVLAKAHWLRHNSFTEWTLVEFFDYECPPCREFAQNESTHLAKYYDQLSIAAHFFPLTIHPMARPAALLAENAEANHNWPRLHQTLMDPNSELDVTLLKKLALESGSDLAKILSDPQPNTLLDSETSLALHLHLNSTPTFLLCSKTQVWKLARLDDLKSLLH